ncbi:MAG: LptA/OstA family protein [Candidatus Bathyarchaeia archaeon]
MPPAHGEQKISSFNFGITEKKGPIQIVSEQLEIHRTEGKAIYKGNVMGKQGDSTILCERLTIFFDKEMNAVQRIIAEGRVRIQTEGRVATAGKADIDSMHRSVVLTENPTIEEGQNNIRGSKITIYLDTERSIVEGEPGHKIQTTIFPTKDVKAQNTGTTRK